MRGVVYEVVYGSYNGTYGYDVSLTVFAKGVFTNEGEAKQHGAYQPSTIRVRA